MGTKPTTLKSPLYEADLWLTSKQYKRAIDEYQNIEDRIDDTNTLKLIKNRILHCKFMLKGIIDCRNDGLGIYHNDAEITLKEAMGIIDELKRQHPNRLLGKSPSFVKSHYDGMTLDELTELKMKFNQEKNKTEARKVRAAMRRIQ